MAEAVLVTGALGQDGRLVAERLPGARIVGVVRDAKAAPPAGAGFAELVSLDLTDPEAVASLVRRVRPSRLFHLAAAHHGSEGPAFDPALLQAMLRTNFLSTAALASAVLQHAPGCRFIHAASSQMYTPGAVHSDVSEATPRQPATYYGHTKSWSMDYVGLMRDRHGLHGASAILFNHESPRRASSFISRKLTLAAAAAARDRSSKVAVRNIGAMTDWSAAEDVADALIAMSQAERPADYVVGSGTLRKVAELAEIAFRCAGLDWRAHVTYERDETPSALRADSGAIRAALGWRPRVPFEAMIERMVDADRTLLDHS
jgi:GDPmannose 4,6-dehydratase